MKEEKKCILCKGKLLKTINDNAVCAITTYDQNFCIGTYIDEYVCTKCGYIQKYSRNPKAFIDSSYRNTESVEEASKIK